MMAAGRVLGQRRAGVLLPASSLCAPGEGALGSRAHRFIDWAAQAGFTVWQLLPLVPVDASGSPYWARTDRAGNPDFIDPRLPDPGTEEDFQLWRASQPWLQDYLLFESISAEQGGNPWWRWPQPLRDREPVALEEASRRLSHHLGARAREQWRFDAQWRALRAHADARGVHLFGDLPLYVAPDSVATWVDRNQFQLDANGEARAVAGVPPDYFAADGQLWGNPLYDWNAHLRDGFCFWTTRLRQQAERFRLLRIDHFRALEAYWEVPAGAPNARAGQWKKAPGEQMLSAVRRALPELELVAEDLGLITAEVIALRKAFELPGMRVLQFAFDGDPHNLHLPHMHEPDSVVYTGTHDNDTTAGWYAAASEEERDRVRRFLARSDGEVPHALMRLALSSVGQLAVLPVQDLLQLGSEARLNRPGTSSGNWSWRVNLDALDASLAAYYRGLIHQFGRSS